MSANQIAENAIEAFLEAIRNRGISLGIDAEDYDVCMANAMAEVSEGTAKIQEALDCLPKCLACDDPLKVNVGEPESWLCCDCAAIEGEKILVEDSDLPF